MSEAKWIAGAHYRGRGAQGEIAVKKNVNGTRYVEAQVECVRGPNEGRRMRWRGYINTKENAARTFADLRVMGVRSNRVGDFTGFGSKEFDFVPGAPESGQDNRTYWRVAFVNELATISKANEVSADELAAIDRELGGLLEAAKPGRPTNVAPAEEDDFPPDDYDDAPRQQEMTR